MPIAAICNTCGHTDHYNLKGSFNNFLDHLNQKGWQLEDSNTICPQCANGHQEILEELTIITYGLHELRHEPGRWSGIYWLWHKGGTYRGMFHLPNDRNFASEQEAKDFAKKDALQKIRAMEWP